MDNQKCVLVIDKTLPQGLIANTAAVLTLSLGKLHPELIGADNINNDGEVHTGITSIPIPILASSPESIKSIRNSLKEEATLVDFSNVAQSTKNYQDYSEKLASTKAEDIEYLGIAVYGTKKIVNKYTGNLGLIR
ncbi:DUF2000 domain-containing protein [Aliivibrio sp. S4TY2]|uniref:DUF2000 domain-containing protein n=1 Tax=unclassified Aliivibrio TaxID=2645654 RepID=UPI0023786B2A|nr:MULTISPECIES: DUF2000 domain-containing protein [unclassified Aliivibrio]MDD9158232.1 DUF2000 domain-containing protein [Aliivibrio sp. S4TY2]MDD9162147.1 DUF2000 domain-containing protein [Aliivibrio sp. S4TY1]MDD9166185.1 DUF2000 domain-containing protein [Aliivibrio sp. S4MY2]MDD9170183.1 DUF2000 domain-containing protein [Aliivibrio sp. S4MY4]MDD9187234.1 DUF2000 domain-containing protein [Aliivibrio sp. S4MY3]